MEFKVRFESDSGAPVRTEHRTVGMASLDKIRNLVGVPKLATMLIHEHIDGVFEIPTIPIPEKIARNSKHFADASDIVVTVLDAGLNHFLDDIVRIQKDTATGEITGARIVSTLDTEAVIKEWRDAGYPREWDPVQVDVHDALTFLFREVPAVKRS